MTRVFGPITAVEAVVVVVLRGFGTGCGAGAATRCGVVVRGAGGVTRGAGAGSDFVVWNTVGGGAGDGSRVVVGAAKSGGGACRGAAAGAGSDFVVSKTAGGGADDGVRTGAGAAGVAEAVEVGCDTLCAGRGAGAGAVLDGAIVICSTCWRGAVGWLWAVLAVRPNALCSKGWRAVLGSTTMRAQTRGHWRLADPAPAGLSHDVD